MCARERGQKAYTDGKSQEDNPYNPCSVPGLQWSIAYVIASIFAERGVSHPQRKEPGSSLTRITKAAI